MRGARLFIVVIVLLLINTPVVFGVIELNQSDCGGVIQDRMEWHFPDGHIEYSPWNTYLDITNEFDIFTTSINKLIITPVENKDVKITLLFNDDRTKEDKKFCNFFTKNVYFFVNSLDQSYGFLSSAEPEQKRYNICFDSSPFLCTYNDGRPQINTPRFVKYISGYGYGINKSNDELNLLFIKGLNSLNNISKYPFNKFESEIMFFFPSKKQLLKYVLVCGNEKLRIMNSTINLVNPLIFDRNKGFYTLELINTDNMNRSLKLEKKGNCFGYSSPSNTEGIQINGYWLYSINSIYEPDKTEFYNYLSNFLFYLIIIIGLPFIMYLINKHYPIFNQKEILFSLVNLALSSAFLILLWDKSELLRNSSPVTLSVGNIIVYASLFFILICTILMVVIIHKLIKSSKKKFDNMKCLQCGHTWRKRKIPNKCPSCQSLDIEKIKIISEGSE